MLTIENINKIWKRDVCEWRIGKIQTHNTAYLFQLYIRNRRHKIQINLERNPIGEQYELWCWDMQDDGTPLRHATPLRRMLDIAELKTMDGLVEQMEKLIKLC
jgi:hypothetical protein